MNVLIFDTETISLEKPFCYNVGYAIMDWDSGEIVCKRDYVVEQIWHNYALFSTAYYAEKRPIYVSAMRGKKCLMDKWGYIMRQMRKDIKTYNIESAYAYNSPFDDKVFTYNNDWFRTNNPFDTIPIYDIRGYAITYLVDNKYKEFCDKNSYYTEAGNYSTTAEIMYRFITGDTTFEEQHTALSDAEIESAILYECKTRGATIATAYSVPKSVERKVTKHFEVKKDGEKVYEVDCESIRVSKDKTAITLK